jgi:DNA-binding response OmpR family regulator
MTEQRKLLALGDFSHSERTRIAAVGNEAAFETHFESDPREASDYIDHHGVQALLLDGESTEGQAFAIERRAESEHATLPLLSLAQEVTDLRFVEAFSWGVDDIVGRDDADPLRSRLRHLPKERVKLPESNRGTVLVAESDRTRRILIGRVLRNAGYTVTFAVEEKDLLHFAKELELNVVVASTSFLEGPREFAEHLRQKSQSTLLVLTCPPRELKRHMAALDGLSGVTTTDAFAPAENVLFAANELGRPRGTDHRASARILYGTKTAFRGVGRDADDYGFTYNVSTGGLYVRTLAPPDDELVWLELCPPRGERRVRLVGKVAWRRGLSKGEYATVPPGFGVEIIDGAKMDIEAWQEGCRALESLLK